MDLKKYYSEEAVKARKAFVIPKLYKEEDSVESPKRRQRKWAEKMNDPAKIEFARRRFSNSAELKIQKKQDLEKRIELVEKTGKRIFTGLERPEFPVAKKFRMPEKLSPKRANTNTNTKRLHKKPQLQPKIIPYVGPADLVGAILCKSSKC
jgi:hypothetical protein